MLRSGVNGVPLRLGTSNARGHPLPGALRVVELVTAAHTDTLRVTFLLQDLKFLGNQSYRYGHPCGGSKVPVALGSVP